MTKEDLASELVDASKITAEQATKNMGVTPMFLPLGLGRMNSHSEQQIKRKSNGPTISTPKDFESG